MSSTLGLLTLPLLAVKENRCQRFVCDSFENLMFMSLDLLLYPSSVRPDQSECTLSSPLVAETADLAPGETKDSAK